MNLSSAYPGVPGESIGYALVFMEHSQYHQGVSWLTGTTVHFCDTGACRAAIITRDTPPSTTVNLVIARTGTGAVVWSIATAVLWAESDPTVDGTWHDHNAPNCPDR